MAAPFNQEHLHGSARFAEYEELVDAGMLDPSPTASMIGFALTGEPLFYHGAGGQLLVAPARSGKLRDILAYNILSGLNQRISQLILDPRGEGAAISRDQTADEKH
ncbi:MAG: hypothetical protein AAF441_29685, partial [Pseudomonadota bacterium]